MMRIPKMNSKKSEPYFSTLTNVFPKLSGQLFSVIRFSKIDIVAEVSGARVVVGLANAALHVENLELTA